MFNYNLTIYWGNTLITLYIGIYPFNIFKPYVSIIGKLLSKLKPNLNFRIAQQNIKYLKYYIKNNLLTKLITF